MIPIDIDAWTATAPAGTVVKEYFGNSQFAVILKFSSGAWAVQQLSTLVYFPAKSYPEAKAIRERIVGRMCAIERGFK